MTRVEIRGVAPQVDPSAWIAPTAVLIGHVVIHEGASVFYGAVLRADRDLIEIGAETNIQDNVVIHGDEGTPTIIGERVSVGHSAVLHGCRIGEGSLVGMGAIVMNGADIGADCLVAAGALVLEGTVTPPRSLLAGSPATVRRELRDAELESLRANAGIYLEIVADHRTGTADRF